MVNLVYNFWQKQDHQVQSRNLGNGSHVCAFVHSVQHEPCIATSQGVSGVNARIANQMGTDLWWIGV